MLVRIGNTAPYIIQSGTVTGEVISSIKPGFAIKSEESWWYSSMGDGSIYPFNFHKIDTAADYKFLTTGSTIRVYSEPSAYEEYTMFMWPPSLPYGAKASVLGKELNGDEIVGEIGRMWGLPLNGGYVAIYSYENSFYVSMTGPYYYLYFAEDTNEVVVANSPDLSYETINVETADGTIKTRKLGILQGKYALLERHALNTYSVEESSITFTLSNTSDKFDFNSGIQYGPNITFNANFEDEDYSIRSFLKYYMPDDGKVEYGGIYPGLGSYKINTDGANLHYTLVLYPDGFDFHRDSYYIDIIKRPPYEDGGFSGEGGGGGTFDPGESDDVSTDVPNGTDIGNDASTGMYTRYLMNNGYMKLLGDWMWDPSFGLSLIKTALESWYGEKNSEALISLLSFPFSLTAPLTGIVTQHQPMYFGHSNIGANYIALKSGGAQIDWGTVSLEEYWGNFLDYSPHTKIELYLPWGTGFVELDPGQVLPGTVTVKTNIEFARGSCVHNVINKDGCVIGTYMGQPGAMIPMVSSDIAAKRAGAVIGAVSAIGAGALGAGALAASSSLEAARQSAAASTYSQVVSSYKTSKMPTLRYFDLKAAGAREAALDRSLRAAEAIPDPGIATTLSKASGFALKSASSAASASARIPATVSRNGGLGDSSAGMMIPYPYLIISRPEQNVPDSYGHHYGYPSNIYERLQFLRGYTEIAAIHLNGIGCTASEMSELEEILAGGVIL